MKKFNYILLAVSLLLLTACLGDIVDSKEALLNKKLKSIISPEMMKIIRGEGMPVHYGTNPPNIEGTYLADEQTMKKSSFEDDDSPGTKYEDEVLTISEQDNEQFTATLKLETGSYSDTYSVVISGKEDKFTLYASTEILFDDNTGVNAVLLYSGRIQEESCMISIAACSSRISRTMDWGISIMRPMGWRRSFPEESHFCQLP